MINKLDIYERAIGSIVDYTDGDITSHLMKEYAIKGMYNLLNCLNHIGIPGENTRLIALPDFTFSRNNYRYNAYFPYGSIIHIDTDESFIPLGFRPNCCGITMLKLSPKDQDINKIKERLRTIVSNNPDISTDDLNRGNHFIGIYNDELYNQIYAIIHGSFSFVKSGYKSMPGLYIDKTNYWNDKMQIANIDGVEFPYLLGNLAKEYFDTYTHYEYITKELRSYIGQHIFPNSQVIFNETHEGFYQMHTITLGAYVNSHPFTAPIMLSAESDLSIVDITKSIPKLPHEMYACPHGGGYALKHISDGVYDHSSRIYKLHFSNNSIMETSDIRKLIYDYRTNTDLTWTGKYGFGVIKRRFSTKYNFKL